MRASALSLDPELPILADPRVPHLEELWACLQEAAKCAFREQVRQTQVHRLALNVGWMLPLALRRTLDEQGLCLLLIFLVACTA